MVKDDLIEIDGEILKVLPNKICEVKLENGHTIIAYLKGVFEERRVRVSVGDKVKVELSIHDPNKGRISMKYNTRDNRNNRNMSVGKHRKYNNNTGFNNKKRKKSN